MHDCALAGGRKTACALLSLEETGMHVGGEIPNELVQNGFVEILLQR